MAAAAGVTVAQVDQIVELGDLDPESIITPGIYIQRVVAVAERPWLMHGAFVGAESA
jgi:3-oxoadipate CoA-transferase alpha subunit